MSLISQLSIGTVAVRGVGWYSVLGGARARPRNGGADGGLCRYGRSRSAEELGCGDPDHSNQIYSSTRRFMYSNEQAFAKRAYQMTGALVN